MVPRGWRGHIATAGGFRSGVKGSIALSRFSRPLYHDAPVGLMATCAHRSHTPPAITLHALATSTVPRPPPARSVAAEDVLDRLAAVLVAGQVDLVRAAGSPSPRLPIFPFSPSPPISPKTRMGGGHPAPSRAVAPHTRTSIGHRETLRAMRACVGSLESASAPPAPSKPLLLQPRQSAMRWRRRGFAPISGQAPHRHQCRRRPICLLNGPPLLLSRLLRAIPPLQSWRRCPRPRQPRSVRTFAAC